MDYEAVVNLEKDIATSISSVIDETCSSSSINISWLDNKSLNLILKEIKKITQTYLDTDLQQELNVYSLFIPNDINRLNGVVSNKEDSYFNLLYVDDTSSINIDFIKYEREKFRCIERYCLNLFTTTGKPLFSKIELKKNNKNIEYMSFKENQTYLFERRFKKGFNFYVKSFGDINTQIIEGNKYKQVLSILKQNSKEKNISEDLVR